jgi:agmatine deiminase
MPAEWEEHEGTWLQWPQEKLCRGYELKLEGMWLAMADVLHGHENVHIIVADERQGDHVEHQLRYFDIGLENVDFHIIPTDDVWARDNGPAFVVNEEGELAITDREVVGIDTVALIEHGGAIGCVTQPQPFASQLDKP